MSLTFLAEQVDALSRWLGEVQIQSRSMDTLPRIFFPFPQVRTALRGGTEVAELGLLDVVQAGSQRQQQEKVQEISSR